MLFKLFNVGHLYINGVYRTNTGHGVLLINSDVTGTVEIGRRSVCFNARKTEYDIT